MSEPDQSRMMKTQHLSQWSHIEAPEVERLIQGLY